MALLFSLFEFIGTISFAISGAMEGIRHKMDMFGVMMLGIVTACGGGVLRDLVIGYTPPRVFRDPTWAIVAMVVAVIVFLAVKRFGKGETRFMHMLNFVADTGGLATFTVLGIEAAGEGNTALLLFAGMICGVGGGVLRDVLTGTVPAVFKKHIYALASVAGALADIMLMRIFPDEIAMTTGFFVVVIIRVLAARFRWNLPRIEE